MADFIRVYLQRPDLAEYLQLTTARNHRAGICENLIIAYGGGKMQIDLLQYEARILGD
jgi:hypothetical protein